MTDTVEFKLAAKLAAAVPGTTLAEMVEIAIDVLAMRVGPSTDYERIGSIVDGSTLTVYRRADGWLFVTFQGLGGWVSERYTQAV